MGSLSLGWLVDTMDMIMSFDPRARQTDVHPSQRAVCPLQDSLAHILTNEVFERGHEPTHKTTMIDPFGSLWIDAACEVIIVHFPNVCVWQLGLLSASQSRLCFISQPLCVCHVVF